MDYINFKYRGSFWGMRESYFNHDYVRREVISRVECILDNTGTPMERISKYTVHYLLNK